MKSTYKVTLLMALCSFTLTSYSAVTTIESSSYDEIATIISEKDTQYNPQNVLLVFDIDNTVLTSHLDVGGDIWYQWQTGKLPLKPTTDQKVSCLYEDTIALLYNVGRMKLTEPSLSDKIKSWQEKHNVFALTSRAPDTRYATERELKRNNVDFSVSPLKSLQDAPNTIYQGKLERSYSYGNGIMFSSGMDKGKVLDYLLDKTSSTFSSIVFIDDGKANIDAMQKMLSSEKYRLVDSTLVLYDKIEADLMKKQGTILTEAQAEKMNTDWIKISETLNNIFTQRASSCG
ncbi:TPA: DUF2608 domain-containing protein [Klebsiella quasipneumoniae subsp. similipneumoniae]|nr:DUF2608 domain-containing protein [Klebsiella quasipneumoniae subsp. similipneumoniae]